MQLLLFKYILRLEKFLSMRDISIQVLIRQYSSVFTLLLHNNPCRLLRIVFECKKKHVTIYFIYFLSIRIHHIS